MSSIYAWKYALFCFSAIVLQIGDTRDSWEEWWTYDGISGPSFWGLINPEWNLCNKGRRQSPINIEPKKLLFDPTLRYLHVDKNRINGVLQNTGQSLIFRADRHARISINITEGALSYKYQFQEMHLHYGIENDGGSEHRIDGKPFLGELQLYGFNSDLYHNMSEARHKSQGIVAIAIMIQNSDIPNQEFRHISNHLSNVIYRDQAVVVKHFSVREILPDTNQFMTYEGSTTYPGCWESCTWIVMNKPIYITRQEIYALRKLMQGDQEMPKAPLGNNIRPLQPLYHRSIRTNIDFNQKNLTYQRRHEFIFNEKSQEICTDLNWKP